MAARKLSMNVPGKLLDMLKDRVAASSQSAVARESGIPLFTIQRCLKGIGDPSSDTLRRFADYFGVSVAELRGEVIAFGTVEISASCAKCGGNVEVHPDRVTCEDAKIEIEVTPCPECCKS